MEWIELAFQFNSIHLFKRQIEIEFFWMCDFFFGQFDSWGGWRFEILKYVSADNNIINWVIRLLAINMWIKYGIFMTLVKSINKAYWLNVEESYNCKKIVETDFPIWILHSVLLTSLNFQIADAYLFFLSLKI